jgi:hypothetical protein
METLFQNALSNPEHYQEDYVHRMQEAPPDSGEPPEYTAPLTHRVTMAEDVDYLTMLGVLRRGELVNRSDYYVPS